MDRSNNFKALKSNILKNFNVIILKQGCRRSL